MAWIIVAGVVVVLAVLAVLVAGRSRSASLKRRFGPEYDRLVAHGDDRHSVESHLRDLVEQRDALDIHELSSDARVELGRRWDAIQLRFVDEPRQSLADADALLKDVMQARGYPAVSVDQRLALLSVDHPRMVETYRTAVAVHERADGGRTDIDALRSAFQQYREVFDELAQPIEESGRDDQRRAGGGTPARA